MALALLLLYAAVIVGFLWRSDFGGYLGIAALVVNLLNVGGTV